MTLELEKVEYVDDVDTITCRECGKEFIKTWHNQIYCCDRCQRRFSYRKLAHGPKYSPEVLKWLERRSIENFVYFYLAEFKHIKCTGKSPPSWTQEIRRHAKRFNLLVYKHPNHKPTFSLTPLALELLENARAGGDNEI